MEKEVKLICKVEKSYLPTEFPVYYFGTSDNEIYVVFSQLYGESGFQYTIAVFNGRNLSYDYEKGELHCFVGGKWRIPIVPPEMFFRVYKRPIKEIENARLAKTNLTYITAKAYIEKLINKKPSKNKMSHPKPPKGKG